MSYSQPSQRASVTTGTDQSRSSPTSYGDTPVQPYIVPTSFEAYHREDLSTSSITTPIFSAQKNSYISASTTTPTGSDDGTQPLRTLDDVRDQVAERLAVRAIRKLKEVDGTKIAVTLTLSKQNDAAFLQMVTGHVHRLLALRTHLIAVATTGVGETCLALVGSSPVQVQRAALLTAAKFVGRLTPIRGADTGALWMATVRDVGWTPYDEAALWDVLTKSAQELIDPTIPPPGSRPIAQILEAARTRLQRLSPRQAYEELHDASIPMPVLLVDIRPHAQREAYGTIRGALVIERNVLEWRFDPRCLDGRLEIANRYDLRVIVICQEGYTSSLAAASLQDVGLLNATDVEGGYKAWKEAGLPVEVRPRWI